MGFFDTAAQGSQNHVPPIPPKSSGKSPRPWSGIASAMALRYAAPSVPYWGLHRNARSHVHDAQNGAVRPPSRESRRRTGYKPQSVRSL